MLHHSKLFLILKLLFARLHNSTTPDFFQHQFRWILPQDHQSSLNPNFYPHPETPANARVRSCIAREIS